MMLHGTVFNTTNVAENIHACNTSLLDHKFSTKLFYENMLRSKYAEEGLVKMF